MTAIRKRPAPAFAAIVGAAGISAVLAGAIPAGAAPDLRAAFTRMDVNGDGAVTLDEIGAGSRPEVRNFEFEQRTGLPGEEPAETTVETFGPILLPVVIDGDPRVIMMHFTHRTGPDGAADQEIALQGPPAPVMAEFEAGDTDGDGALTFGEFEARYMIMRANSFAQLDADGDGAIGESEMVNPIDGEDGDTIADALRGIDADGDGRVTRAEYEDAV